MNYINLTPHALNVYKADGSIETIAPSGMVARVDSTDERVATLEGFEVVVTTFGEVEGLPDAEAQTLYIVSGMVLDAMKGKARPDLLAPGKLVRNAEGQPIGCKGFRTNPMG